MNLNKLIIFATYICFLNSCSKQQKNIKLAENYYKLAICELSDRRDDKYSYKKALNYINQALQENETSEYLGLQGTLLFELKLHRKSLEIFKKALSTCKNPHLKTEILNNYACVLAAEGNKQKALYIFRQLEKNQYYLTPEVALVNIGKIYLEMKQINKAKQCFIKATKAEPSFLDAHYYSSIVLYKLGQKKIARDYIKTILFMSPEHEKAKNLLKLINS